MSNLQTTVFCRLQFEAMHRWPGAFEDVGYLAYPHRHIFHVEAHKLVRHSDRDIEFITLKKEIARAIESKLNEEPTGDDDHGTLNWSCERWAIWLLETFYLSECSVSEDGENGARIKVAK